MNSILYAASIGTFATWLGFSSASMVGIMVPGKPVHLPALKQQETPKFVFTEGEYMEEDMVAGGSSQQSEVDSQDNQEQVFNEEAATPEVVEIPDVPEVAEMEPLPDVPDLPEKAPELKPSENTFAVAKKAPAAAKTSVKRAETANRGSNTPVAKRTQSGNGTGSGSSGTAGAGAGTQGQGRISGGRTPKPPYPPLARKNKIEGTVRLSITFGENGEVTNCRIVSASDPSLNDEATIRPTIMKWKKPGMRGTFTLPVNFKFD